MHRACSKCLCWCWACLLLSNEVLTGLPLTGCVAPTYPYYHDAAQPHPLSATAQHSMHPLQPTALPGQLQQATALKHTTAAAVDTHLCCVQTSEGASDATCTCNLQLLKSPQNPLTAVDSTKHWLAATMEHTCSTVLQPLTHLHQAAQAPATHTMC